MAQILFNNKRAYHDFDVIEKLEAGIALQGWEVKSMKASNIGMQAAYVFYDPQGELLLRGMQISSWKNAEQQPLEMQKRDRKLLLHKREMLKVGDLAKRPGYTVVPLEGYINDKGLIKIVIAVVKGKRKFEKKQQIKERDIERELRNDRAKYKF